MKQLFTGIILFTLMLTSRGYAQDSSFRMHVLTKNSVDTLYYDKKVACATHELEMDKKLQAHDKKTCTNGIKTVKTAVPAISARANIYIDSKDPSKLRLNYWLFYPFKLFKVKVIPYTGSEPTNTNGHNIKSSCGRVPFTVPQAINVIKTSKDKCKRYNADEVIRGTDFYLPLENREYKQFKFRSWNATVLTLPIKYYFPFEKNAVSIPSRSTASVNGNLYLNGRIGRARYFYERNSSKKIYVSWQASTGFITGLSVNEINKSNTLLRQAAGDTLSSSRFSPVFTVGWGVTYGFRQYNFGVFAGLDYAIGSNHDYWDYQGRPWIGFGITVSSLLSLL